MIKDKREGQIAKEIEDYTAALPSDAYLWTAVGFMCISLTFKILRRDDMALFIGQWAAPTLLAGVYNKIVKTQGSD
jgi:hypothetical protein